jgi:hypothetical protein
MRSKTQRITGAIVLFFVFCISQVYLSAGFAAPDAAVKDEPAQTQDWSGILTTNSNKAITVNGAASITGATILSGATIETPAGVGATVTLAKLGSLEIEQDAKLILTFQVDRIHVLLLKGCVTLHTDKNITGKIETSKDAISETDPKDVGVLRVCHPNAVKLAAASPAGGLGKLATAAIIGGPAAALIPVITPGDNPSNSNPN